jgi:carboxymethylenebutenolidase
MCHDADSRPPAPPVRGEVASSQELVLTAADGNRFAAHQATPPGRARAAVLVLPDIRGLHPYYRALTDRLAEAGLHAVAYDYFGRTAGVGERGEGFDWQAHVPQVTPGQVAIDVAAVQAHLAGTVGDLPVYTLGFCFGGGHSWKLSTAGLGLAGVIGFYGRAAMVDDVDQVSCPVLMLVAGADHAWPLADSTGLADRLRAAGKDVTIEVFDGAPHSFFDRSFAQWKPACDRAWQLILEFIGR